MALSPATVPDSLLRFEQPIFEYMENEDTSSAAERAPAKRERTSSQLDDMVNSMLPAREWTEETGTWMQHVSKEPATRLDVVTLQEMLDQRLAERQAREAGICPVREELYAQCFDELIREVSDTDALYALHCCRRPRHESAVSRK